LATQEELLLTEAGLSSLGVPGVPWHTQILAEQLTLKKANDFFPKFLPLDVFGV
jgi:hypothetical protein